MVSTLLDDSRLVGAPPLPWEPQPSLDYSGNEGLSFKIRKKLCLYLPPHLLPNTIHGGLGQIKWWTQLRIEIFDKDKMISLFFQRSFWGGGIGRGDFTFWDGNYSKRLCFWVTWEGEVWLFLFFKVGRLGFFFVFQKIFFWWCGMGWNFFFPPFFFHNMMT